MLCLVVLRDSCCFKCLFLNGPFCHGTRKPDPIYIVCNKFEILFNVYEVMYDFLMFFKSCKSMFAVLKEC